MSLITSISGVRGTIGGYAGDGMTPMDIVKYASAYAVWLKRAASKERPVVVLGRDARMSGEMLENLVSGTLCGMGVDVILLGFATTPTVEMAVPELQADGGIILTASHNPKEWNALKLLNSLGEFLSAENGNEIISLVKSGDFNYAEVSAIGKVMRNNEMDRFHIKKVLELSLVDREKVAEAKFKVVIDCVNSVGGIIIPQLLKALGVAEIVELYCEPTGDFPHNPEPLPANLTAISKAVKEHKADLGFVVDPDVDRLAIVSEDGSMFGEEYTLVSVADYVLSNTPGSTCSNLSSSRALRDISTMYGQEYYASAVGEVNVVEMMKKQGSVIGGEGNGGVIYPELHYGRDSLVGIALFLTYLAKKKKKCSELRNEYPSYEMIKNKISLTPETDTNNLLKALKNKFSTEKITTVDGLKIDFDSGWVHLRKSNTEPIIRIYAEAKNVAEAQKYIEIIMKEVRKI